MFNKIIFIDRLGQNAEAKTAQNNRNYAVFNVATQESWKNDKGDPETRTEWHRVYAWGKLSKFTGKLERGQLITLEGTLRYREAESEQHGKQRFAEVHASSIKRLFQIRESGRSARWCQRRVGLRRGRLRPALYSSDDSPQTRAVSDVGEVNASSKKLWEGRDSSTVPQLSMASPSPRSC